MLDRGEFIPISEFERDVAGHIKRVTKNRSPAMVTSRGKTAAVVMSPNEYRDLRAAREQVDLLETIRKGREDIAAGRYRPWAEVRRSLLKRLERNLKKARR